MFPQVHRPPVLLLSRGSLLCRFVQAGIDLVPVGRGPLNTPAVSAVAGEAGQAKAGEAAGRGTARLSLPLGSSAVCSPAGPMS